MKIIALEAENIKRLKAVRIEPDGTMQVIGGRNAQGKSSVLDAVWLALGGRDAAKDTSRPIRDGESRASVSLDLGDLTVTRTWTAKGSQLKVRSKDGATFDKPQTMLDALVGAVGFDPLAFTRQSAKAQRETLLGLVDLDVDLDALAVERSRLYDERTEIGRQGKALGEVPDVPADAPTEEVSASDLLDKISKAEAQNREIDRHSDEAQWVRKQIADKEDELKQLRDALADHERALSGAKLIDTYTMRAELDGIEESNRQARANAEAIQRKAKHDVLASEYVACTAAIDKIDSDRSDALASAKFPIDGLGFDDDGVTYQGVPLSQASSAEQIRVSLAIGMALNPKLKVLMIRDGSLLDGESMEAIREQVEAHGFQLFVERVGDADQGAVIIEDGEVA